MRGKVLFVAGVAVGYVLGARAGRKRYEQIKAAATKVWESPGIQKQVTAVEDYVAAKAGDLPQAVFVSVKKLVVQAARRRQEARTPYPSPAAEAALEAAREGDGPQTAGPDEKG